MKLLVLASEPIGAQQLRSALPVGVDPQDAEVMVVAPALQTSALRFWLSDVDQAIAKANEVQQATVRALDDVGVSASGDTGESDPLDALSDALITFAADRIVLFTHPDTDKRYREDIDVAEVRQRFGLPVDHAIISPSSAKNGDESVSEPGRGGR